MAVLRDRTGTMIENISQDKWQGLLKAQRRNLLEHSRKWELLGASERGHGITKISFQIILSNLKLNHSLT